jgi:outer membrane receptor protein involved in Fe transport
MSPSEMTSAKMAAPTEMPPAVPAATKMAPTVAASAAPAQRRARQHGHKNHSGNRNARPPHGTLPGCRHLRRQ